MKYQTYTKIARLTGAGRAAIQSAVLLLGTSGFAPAIRATTTTFLPNTPYSETLNPNGTWTYGWSQTRGSEFHTFDKVDHFGLNDFQWHNNGLGQFPFIAFDLFNTGTGFHPGASGENAVLRWTASGSGTLQISALFENGDPTLGATTDVAILLNGSELYSGFVNRAIPAPLYSSSIAVSAGDKLDFTVGFGNGNYFFDSTHLDLNLALTTKTGSVPEEGASATLLLGTSLAGLIALRGRQPKRVS